MPRARNIKPGFYRDVDLISLPPATRLLFPGLWMLADRAGRLEDNPRQIKIEIYPSDAFDVDTMLDQLADSALILRYAVGERRFIQIRNFQKHQNPHKNEPPSVIPPPPNSLLEASASRHYASASRHYPSTSGHYPSTPADLLIPDSGFLTPDSGFLTPDSGSPVPSEPQNRLEPPNLLQPPRKKPAGAVAGNGKTFKPNPKPPPLTNATWDAYSHAYQNRYDAAPVRNASINAKLKHFVARIGAEEAPAVASFYVTHNDRFYVQKMHPLNIMLADAEKLRTEWTTGQKMTETKARETDRRAKHGEDWNELLAESRGNGVTRAGK